MESGALVPLNLTTQVLKKGVAAKPANSYLFDGFPRQMDQVEYLEYSHLF